MKISIITINYNNAAGLEKTLNSVFNQTYQSYEHIVIDGGSTDGSKHIIETYGNKLSYWVSEKDHGIYNAMNKGIAKASGDYLQFLNSGDYLLDNLTLEKIALYISKNNFDFYYSDVINSKTNLIHNYPVKLTFKYFFEYTINHQSIFFKKELFDLFGTYNESFKIVSDWEFILKILFLHNRTYCHIKQPIIYFDYEGLSTSPKSVNLIQEERSIVLKQYFSNLIPDFVFFKYVETSKTWLILQKINKFRNWKKQRIY